MRKSAVLLVAVLGVFIVLGAMLLQSLVVVQRIATLSEMAGDVYVKARTDADFRPLGEQEHVLAGHAVRTGPDAGATLNWVDGSRVRLGPDTTIRVRKCELNTNTRARTSLFDLDAGRIWVRVLSALGGKTKFAIRTPTATAGVRGTVFYVGVDDSGRTEVAVYEGEVNVEGEAGAAGVGPGEQATALQGGEPTVTRQPEGALDWEQRTGIIGPRLDLSVGPDVNLPKGASSLTVSGVSEPGARVTINGTPVELDGRNWFSAEVPAEGTEEGLIVVSTSDAHGATTVRAVTITRES